MKGTFKKRIDKVEAEARPSGSDMTDSEKVGLLVVKVANAIRQDKRRIIRYLGETQSRRANIEMEFVSVSIISEKLYKTEFSQARLRTTNILLKLYTGQVMTPNRGSESEHAH